VRADTRQTPDYFFRRAKLPYKTVVYRADQYTLDTEVVNQMAAVLVGQFHARDAEGRIYSVHEFKESEVDTTNSSDGVTYKLAIGDRLKHLGNDEFELVQSGVKIIREPEYVPPVV
jgi:hypothetical protein